MNTMRIQKKVLTLSCAALLALPLSAAGPSAMRIYAEDEVATEETSGGESSLSAVQDDSAQPGGSLFLVIRKQQGAESCIKYLKTVYASVEKLDRSAGYWVLQAVKA